MDRVDLRKCVRRMAAAAVFGRMLAAVVSASAVTSGVTISTEVLSATALDATGCQTNTPATSFGLIHPESAAITPEDCAITFGSTNGSASLRMYQREQHGAAMVMSGWNAQASGAGSVLYDVAAADDRRAWAVGWNGTIRATTDGGSTWSPQASPQTTRPWWAFDATSATDLHVAGEAGNVAVSTDGTTWAAQASGVTTHLYALDFRTSQVGIVAGAGGTTRVTADGGATWLAGGASGTTGALYGVAHVAGTEWVAVGASSVIRRTVNDGAAWTTISSPVAGVNLRSVRSGSGSVWAVGDGGRIFRSTDAGLTFSNVPSGTTANLDDVAILSSTEVLVVGTNGAVRRTRDAGATWNQDNSGTTTWVRGVTTSPGGAAWVAGEGGMIRTYGVTSTIADFTPGSSDWGASGSLFAACLRAVADGAVTSSATWSADSDTIGDEPAGEADCGDQDADPWNAIAPLAGSPGAVVASSAAQSTVASQARIRFGARASAAQPPGTYRASVSIDVIAASP